MKTSARKTSFAAATPLFVALLTASCNTNPLLGKWQNSTPTGGDDLVGVAQTMACGWGMNTIEFLRDKTVVVGESYSGTYRLLQDSRVELTVQGQASVWTYTISGDRLTMTVSTILMPITCEYTRVRG